MNNGVDLLRQDHGNIQLMMSRFSSSDNRAEKESIWTIELAPEIWRHLEIERAVLIPVCQFVLPPQDYSRDSLAMEQSDLVRSHLQIMNGMDIHDVQFMDQYQAMSNDFIDHINKQEASLFPLLERRLSENQLDLLYVCLGNAKTLAPDRPQNQVSSSQDRKVSISTTDGQSLPSWLSHPSIAVSLNRLLHDEKLTHKQTPINQSH